MNITLASTGDRARWNGYVERSADASLYHRWEFNEIFHDVYGPLALPLMATDHGRVTGVLPLTRLSSPMFGTSLVSVPYFGHGGAIADDEETFRALLAEAQRLRAVHGAKHVELRHAHTTPALDLPARTDKVLMHLHLPATDEELLKAVGPKARADIRRPEKEGMTATVGGRELVGDFHTCYAAVMRDLGSPCHSVELFDEVIRRMPERSFIVVVRYAGRPIGAGFLCGMGTTLEIPCAGTLHQLSKLRANMFLYWNVLREAIRRGYKTFSFGRSSEDSGTYTFKKNWGAVPVPLPYHYLLADGATLPTLNPHNPKYARVIETWQKLPVPVATLLGPRIVRYIA